MSLPNEYVIEDAIKSIDDVIVYRASHPIHGTVNAYLPDEALPPELATDIKRRLYKSGRQMRNISLLNIPFITKSLEVSQNPNEPYIVTKYAEHDLEELISNGVTLPAKRIFAILSQVLQSIVELASNDWVLSYLYPRQIKLSDLDASDVSLTLIEGAEQQITVTKTITAKVNDKPGVTILPKDETEEDNNDNQTVSTQTSSITKTIGDKVTNTFTSDERSDIKKSRITKRNIYVLGNITYQLLFGRKYLPNSKIAEADIVSLSGRWRGILEKAINRDTDHGYDIYKTMLRDVDKALNRNKRLAAYSIPLWVILVIIGSYFGYQRYHQHKIMTSPAGQAIESFLNVVNKTSDEFPEPEKPKLSESKPDDKTILKPFNKIETIPKD